jgi:hypothetical protein
MDHHLRVRRFLAYGSVARQLPLALSRKVRRQFAHTASVYSSTREVLDGGGYLHPRVACLFPHRPDRLHRMGVIKQTDRHTGHGRVFRASHVNGRAALRTEELTKHAAEVGGSIKLQSFTLDLHLRVRPVRCFTEG